LVEDEDDDAVLVLRELRRLGYEVASDRVCTAEAMRSALTEKTWDLVISDYAMPGFGAPAALAELKASALDLQFLILSGTIGEETAVECMRAGAHDFLIKSKLARLGAAIERELRAAKDRALQREEEKKNRALEIAKAEAERIARFKTQFLANMSHELRTPLNAILGFSEMLQRSEPPSELSPVQQEYVGYVLECGQHLLRLIDDVLDMSAIEAGRIELQRELVSPRQMAEMVAEIVRPMARQRGTDLELEIAPALRAISVDSVRLKQILYNLLSNAIKFTSSGGHVRLHVMASADETTFAVEDTGIGISAEDQQRLFREFERIDPEGGHRGTGLGLALTKHLVELHGGRIRIESTPGQGSTFTVVLPNGTSQDTRAGATS